MASITLDRTRHFSQIYGQTENGAIYFQDGIDFRGDGTAILTDEQASALAAEQAAAEQAAAEQAAAEQAAAEQAAAEQAAPKAKKPKAKTDSAPESSDDEDLA